MKNIWTRFTATKRNLPNALSQSLDWYSWDKILRPERDVSLSSPLTREAPDPGALPASTQGDVGAGCPHPFHPPETLFQIQSAYRSTRIRTQNHRVSPCRGLHWVKDEKKWCRSRGQGSGQWDSWGAAGRTNQVLVLVLSFPGPISLIFKKELTGNSLTVQWLGLSAFTAGTWVQSLVGN